MGQRLCYRGPSGFELTDAGQVLYRQIQEVYEKLNQVPDSLNTSTNEVRGRIRLRIISNFVSTRFDRILVEFSKRCPLVELQVEVAPWETISLAVLRNEVDVGVAPIHSKYPELSYEMIKREAHLVYCGVRHPRYGSQIESPDELCDDPLILTGADEPESLTYYRMRHGLGKQIAATTPNLEEAKRLTILGVGICMLPARLAQPDVKNGLLWPLTTTSSKFASCDVYAITNNQAAKRPVTDYFKEELVRSSTRPAHVSVSSTEKAATRRKKMARTS